MPKKKNVKPEEVIVENVVEETVTENDVEEVVEVVEEAPTPFGVVSNCVQLNVRKKPDKKSDVVCILNYNEEVTINDSKSDKWFEITTKNGVKGYCMKEYIKIK